MDKILRKFLTEKGFKEHPEEKNKMILELGPNAGVVVFGFDEDCHEFIMNYLSNGSGDPELIFSGLTRADLINRFDIMYQISYNLYHFLVSRQF